MIREEDTENTECTHFIIDTDHGLIFLFAGDKEVKYADVVSFGEGITMLVRLSGGKMRILKLFSLYLRAITATIQ